MIRQLVDRWWVFVVRGALAILFGIVTFVAPAVTLTFLIALFAAYTIVDGVVAVLAAFGRRRAGESLPWPILLVGLAGIVAGVVMLMYPGVTALMLLFLLAAWHVVRGLFEIVVAVRLRREIEGEGWLITAGALSVLFGLLLFARPGAGALAVLWMIGAFAMLFGVFLIALGVRLRQVGAAAA